METKKKLFALAMLVMLAFTSIVAYAQNEEQQILAKAQAGVNRIIAFLVPLFWIVFGLIFVGSVLYWMMSSSDADTKRDMMNKLKYWIIGSFLLSVASSVVGFLRNVWR